MKQNKCWNCKKRNAKFECSCGCLICDICYNKYEGNCPADEQEYHLIEKYGK